MVGQMREQVESINAQQADSGRLLAEGVPGKAIVRDMGVPERGAAWLNLTLDLEVHPRTREPYRVANEYLVPAAVPLAPGVELPVMIDPARDGDEVRLADLRGQAVVLYFYPRASTPGCTTQACGNRDRRADYAAAGAGVIGVSPDEVSAVAKFAGKHSLDLTLLADTDHAVAGAYGTWVEKSIYGRKHWGVRRATFTIGAEQTILPGVAQAKKKAIARIV